MTRWLSFFRSRQTNLAAAFPWDRAELVVACLSRAKTTVWPAADLVCIVFVLAIVFPEADRADLVTWPPCASRICCIGSIAATHHVKWPQVAPQMNSIAKSLVAREYA
jgi:hypothetical protein